MWLWSTNTLFWQLSVDHNIDVYHQVNHRLHVPTLARKFDILYLFPCGVVGPWIIERLDRKLADATGSNIVEKCDVMFSRAIQPLTSDVLRVLFFIAYFDYKVCPCFEVKDEEELFLEKIDWGYKTGRGKRQSKWLWNLWERRMTQAPDKSGSLAT